MTVKDAFDIFKTFADERPNLVPMTCYEYDSCFVFHAVPIKHATSEDANKVFDSLYSVNKITGELDRFTPFKIPSEEYKRGKLVAKFN